MSASAATGSSEMMSAIWVALTIQIELSAEMSRSCAMKGSARLVIELLITDIISPMVIVATANRRGQPAGIPSGGACAA